MLSGRSGVASSISPLGRAVDADGATVDEALDVRGPRRFEQVVRAHHVDFPEMLVGHVHLVLRRRQVEYRTGTIHGLLHGSPVGDRAKHNLAAPGLDQRAVLPAPHRAPRQGRARARRSPGNADPASSL